MRTLRGGNSKIDSKMEKSKNSDGEDKESTGKENEKVIDDDDDIGANGDETTDDEGGIDTPPPPPEEDEDSKEEKLDDVVEPAIKEKRKKKKVENSKLKKDETDDAKVTNDETDKKKVKEDETDGEEAKPVEENVEEEYEVEQIVDMEVQKRKKCPVSFRVRWQGFTEKDDTWLPASQLSCEDLVQDFLEISGRKSEYERAFESSRKRNADSLNENRRQSSRKSAKISYSELDEEQNNKRSADNGSDFEDEILPSGTRSRKIKTKAEKKEMPTLSAAKKKAKKNDVSSQPEKEVEATTQQSQSQEHFEVEKIVDHRVKGRFTDYKIRWKGFGPKEDIWLPEADLNCPSLIKAYNKNLHAKPKAEEEYEVEAIAGMREIKGRVEYKVRWKNWGPKYDSWLPEDELNCTEILARFKSTLEKLEKQTDWQVEKIMEARERKGRKEYLIHWQGFETKFDTWEPEENLEGCKDILEKYKKEKEKATEKLLKSGRKTREDRPRPERYAENFTGGSRARSKRKSAAASYSEFYDE